jgi:hypothetical protein
MKDDGDGCVFVLTRNVNSNIANCENNDGNPKSALALSELEGRREEIILEVKGREKEKDRVCTDHV